MFLKKLIYLLLRPRFWSLLPFRVAPSIEHFDVIRPLDVEAFIDVGANRGQFALACVTMKPNAVVFSFEPIEWERRVLKKVVCGRGDVRVFNEALGDVNGSSVLHLSRRADSSSLLPIGNSQRLIFDGTEEVGAVEVDVKRLDDFLNIFREFRTIFLKIDVQGFELQVLRGGICVLGIVNYVYVECSEIELYEGQALRADVAKFLAEHGFVFVDRFNPQYFGGKMVQADYLFRRQ